MLLCRVYFMNSKYLWIRLRHPKWTNSKTYKGIVLKRRFHFSLILFCAAKRARKEPFLVGSLAAWRIFGYFRRGKVEAEQRHLSHEATERQEEKSHHTSPRVISLTKICWFLNFFTFKKKLFSIQLEFNYRLFYFILHFFLCSIQSGYLYFACIPLCLKDLHPLLLFIYLLSSLLFFIIVVIYYHYYYLLSLLFFLHLTFTGFDFTDF